MRAELRDRGFEVSRKRVARLMRKHGICGVSRRHSLKLKDRKRFRITDPEPCRIR